MLSRTELLLEMARVAMYLYEHGAVGLSSALEYSDLEAFVGGDERDLARVIEDLEEARTVRASGAPRKFEGTSYAGARFWLTGPGLEETSHMASQIGHSQGSKQGSGATAEHAAAVCQKKRLPAESNLKGLIDAVCEEERLRAESYLKGLTDYVKWTTTLAGAAVLWVGNGLMSLSMLPQVVATVGLLLLSASSVAAVFAVFYVLGMQRKEWTETRTWSRFYDTERVIQDIEAAFGPGHAEPMETESLEHLREALDAAQEAEISRDPAVFQRWAGTHVALLVAGLCAYVLAQVLALK